MTSPAADFQPSSLPEWLTNDAEEREELAALGIVADVATTCDDQAARDAHASSLLRALGRIEAEMAEREAARDAELNQVRNIYLTELERLARRASFVAGAIESLAMVSDFGPKKKSRTVGFGTYGRRTKPLALEITDDAAALTWATEQLPEAIAAAVVLTQSEVMRITDAGLGEIVAESRLTWKLSKAPLKVYVESTGDTEIAGVVVTLPVDKPFAKALAPKDAAR